MTTALQPFFHYFGAKFRAAGHYPPPQHDWIVEPFAGSAGYAMRYPDRQVVLVEASEPIAAIWQYLTLVSPREVLRLPLLEPGQSVDSLGAVPVEARLLIGMWANPRNARPGRTMARWAPTNPCQLWGAPVRERIASQLHRIAHWIVKPGDYTRAPSVNATWFVDPPYQRKFASYYGPILDYSDLGRWCRSRRGQVIVCEGDGAEWLPFEHLLAARSKHHRGQRRASELVWTQGA